MILPSDFDFTLSVQEDIYVIRLNFTRATLKEAAKFKEIVNMAFIQKYRKFIIDLDDVSFIDSTFLGVLVWAQKKLSTQEGEMTLIGIDKDIYTIIGAMNLIKLFKISDNMESAVNYLSTK
ncbi:MAG TPA: STAS domain-containing protein [Ignavibacteriaceae bacterium]|nr:STAS domain-containing protein [Ignavibacteriaceae bacterium]